MWAWHLLLRLDAAVLVVLIWVALVSGAAWLIGWLCDGITREWRRATRK